MELMCVFPVLPPLRGRDCASLQLEGRLRGCPCSLPLPFSMRPRSCQSRLQLGRKEQGEHRFLRGCDSQDAGQRRERKVGEGAKKYIQRSPCYASVQLQIVLCTERVMEDVEGWQGKFGVR